jgi:hypothetical protein
MNKLEPNPQLVIKRYDPKGTTFAHCLICSTAPKNAESRYREDLSPGYSLDHLNQIKEVLKKFIESNWNNTGEDVLKKISIILDIHGFNVPLANLEKNTYEPLVKKFKLDTSDRNFTDFVLFINFSWPSEQVVVSQFFAWFRAMPLMLWIALIGAVALAVLFWSNLLYSLGLVLVGLLLCLVFLRLAVYFRDRDRATNHGVFDAVELVRWLHEILQEILSEKANSPEGKEHLKSNSEFFGTANLSFIAHSMGCFVATQTIRVLSDVFDPCAINRWKTHSSDGPFGGIKTECPAEADEIAELQKIGNFFRLKSLILASPDIPIWAITTGRSNFLRTCLRRFDEAYLFTNDADMVLRLASTVANYFVFPSASRIGGYRLGNLTCTGDRSYGAINLDATELGVRTFTRSIKLIDKPFSSQNAVYQSFTVVDCTDYRDKLVAGSGSLGRRLSVLTANNSAANLLNYILTAISHFLGIGQIDSHGGYFRGQFCLDLLYSLALYGKDITKNQFEKKFGTSWDQQFKKYQMAWIQTSDDEGGNATKA